MKNLSLRQIIRGKNPDFEAALPEVAVRLLEHFLCIDKLDDLLSMGQGMAPLDFVDAVLARLGISYEGLWEEKPRDERLVFASNHPFGALDGMMLGHCIGRRFGDVRIGVNDLLMSLTPLRPIFLPVNKFGRQSGVVAERLESELRGDVPIVVFPAGLCSRRRGGVVRDEEWHTGFIKRAVMAERDVVPVYVEGGLSSHFYRLANLRRRLGVKFNIEMLRLPSEVFAQQGRHYRIVFGSPIAWEILALEGTPQRQTRLVRDEMERLRHYC